MKISTNPVVTTYLSYFKAIFLDGTCGSGSIKRLDFMNEQRLVPDDFDPMGRTEIDQIFNGKAELMSISNREIYLAQLRDLVLANTPGSIQVFLFGSSARGDTRMTSDVDIGLWDRAHQPIDKKLLAKLREKIELSTIPYSVDVVDFASVGEIFRTKALKESRIWKE